MISRCPYCRKAAPSEDKSLWPFCSKRCKAADLGKWFSEEYRVPDKEGEAEDTQSGEDDPSDDDISLN